VKKPDLRKGSGFFVGGSDMSFHLTHVAGKLASAVGILPAYRAWRWIVMQSAVNFASAEIASRADGVRENELRPPDGDRYLPVQDAMASGLPLILYRNPASDHPIESTKAGILVVGGIATLAEAFVRCDAQRERLVQVLEAGIEAAVTRTLDACHAKRAELATVSIRATLAGRAIVATA
jgi:hypothetical protein